ncbi:hypothetical protein BIW11_05849, partial [Tropilaelaps mercedesae]
MPNGRMAGMIGGFFEAVTASFNITYSLTMPIDVQWGSCEPDGSSCTGMLGDLFYNKSDASIGPFGLSPVYSGLFRQGVPVKFETFKVMTGTQIAYAVNAFSTFTGIEGKVYCLFLVLPLSIAILAAINTRWILPRIGQEDNNRVPRLFLDLIRLNAQNAPNIDVQSSSNRLLVTGCMIASLFAAIIVSSSIKASMMRRDPTERPKTIADILKRTHKIHPVVPPKTYLTDILEAEESGEMHELYESIKTYGFVPVYDMMSPENIRGILNGTKYMFMNCDFINIFMASTYFALSEKHRGYLICLEQTIVTMPTSWYFQNSMPPAFVKEFNKRTQWLIETPTRFVFDFKYARVPPDRFARSTSLSGDAVMEALRVDEVIGCFYVLAGGTGGALVA